MPGGLYINLKTLSREPFWGEKVCIRGSEYNLFEILPKPRTLIRFNIVTGTIFLNFWCGIISP